MVLKPILRFCILLFYILLVCLFLISVLLEHEKQLEKELPPTDESLVQMKHPKHVRIIYHDPDESPSEEDDTLDADSDGGMDADGEKVMLMCIFQFLIAMI